MLTRWDPFAEIARLQDQFARWAGKETPFGPSFTPAIDIFDEKDTIVVKAELPGIKSDDVKVTVEHNVLTITGERKLEQAEKREGYHRVEREYGSFSRSFTLPSSVDADHVEADLADGVLTVRVPKKPAPEPKSIEVKSGSQRQTIKTGKPS
jgi:HSP20 family protein